MWTRQNRARYDRSRLRDPSDLTDEKWRLVEPLIGPGKPGCGKRRVIMREGRERADLHSFDRQSVARDSQGPATEEHGLWLFRPVDL
jgi:hypothetical protein